MKEMKIKELVLRKPRDKMISFELTLRNKLMEMKKDEMNSSGYLLCLLWLLPSRLNRLTPRNQDQKNNSNKFLI